jgi:hypothetical protein
LIVELGYKRHHVYLVTHGRLLSSGIADLLGHDTRMFENTND